MNSAQEIPISSHRPNIEMAVNTSASLPTEFNSALLEEEQRRFEEMRDELVSYKNQLKEVEFKLQEERHQVEMKNTKIRSLEDQFNKKVSGKYV